jgi:aconitate hydratase
MPNLTRKLISSHLVDGALEPGREIALRIDQTLAQDATGTLVMLELESLGLDRVRTEVSAQYVDHNLLQEDNKNPDDHLFLESGCRRFGLYYGAPGTGVSHPVHMQQLGVPGRTLLGADSHTCASGSLGMLAIGAGGLDVAFAMAGEPYVLAMPEVVGIELRGELPAWVSAKDVILELLRRHGVTGGRGRVFEYFGPGLARLSAMDRHVIANMGAELGATTSVFPSDARTREFMQARGRGLAWTEQLADADADYEHHEVIDLSTLVPLIALPSSPANVVPVAEVAGEPIYQSYIGSSANPGFRDFAIAAEMLRGASVPASVSLDISPTSREVLLQLISSGHLRMLLAAGARVHQAGCNGCIGMGQAPATDRNSLRTVPRNFPGRSGTREDRVFLCSPETAAASALLGCITDPRALELDPIVIGPEPIVEARWLRPPSEPSEPRAALVMGPNIKPLPHFEPLPDALELEILLALGDDISTDEILPAGARVLPHRSNIPKIAEYLFEEYQPDYAARARAAGNHAIAAGRNYGQGSSREHAALAPRALGLRVVFARSFARIHRSNLINYGVLPLLLPEDLALTPGDRVRVQNLQRLGQTADCEVEIAGRGSWRLVHDLSAREAEYVRGGGRVSHHRRYV